MSRRHASERESGYGRDDRGDRRERDARPVQREREPGSRTPTRTTAEVRSTTAVESRNVTAIDPRSTLPTRTGVESRETRDVRGVPDPRSGRDPRETPYNRDPRTGVDPAERRPVDGRDIPRDTRTAPPVVATRDSRSRPEEISPRQGPRNDYFLPGEEISREVITADICRYLGPDALVRPYQHPDVSSFLRCELAMLSLVQGRDGFIITAYRALTSVSKPRKRVIVLHWLTACLSQAMISTLKLDSAKFESENRRRLNAGYRAQSYAPTGYDQPGRMDPYADDRAAPTNRVDGRYEPEPRRSRTQPSGYDEMDIDDPQDSRAPRYTREMYDPRDSQGRPQVSTGYAQPGRDPYAYDGRPEPRLDSRVDPRIELRTDPRVDPRGYSQPTGMPLDRDYTMTDGRTAYGDPRTGQPIYAAARPDPYGTVPASQAGAIPRAARDEPQVYIDPRTGQPMMAAPRPSEVRHARPDRDHDGRGYR
jgi:hypothetical protein